MCTPIERQTAGFQVNMISRSEFNNHYLPSYIALLTFFYETTFTFVFTDHEGTSTRRY